MPGQPQRFLIFNNGMIGNTLFNMPAAQWLKRTFPGCFVGMVVEVGGLGLVKNDPHVDIFHIFNKKTDSLGQQFRLIMALRREKYEVSLHLRKGVRNELLARLGGVKFRAGYSLKGSLQHLHVKVDEDDSVHRLKSRAQLMEAAFDRPVELDNPVVYHDNAARAEIDRILAEKGVETGRYIVFHPTGTSMGDYAWRLPIYAEAFRSLGGIMPIFVICLASEKNEVEKIIPAGAGVYYHAADIATTSELISSAGLFIGNDSGPAHIACAWGIPRVVFYRDTVANFIKWQPIDTTDCKVIFQPDFTSEAVVNAVTQLMEGKQ